MLVSTLLGSGDKKESKAGFLHARKWESNGELHQPGTLYWLVVSHFSVQLWLNIYYIYFLLIRMSELKLYTFLDKL